MLDSIYSYRFVIYIVLTVVLVYFLTDYSIKNNRQYSVHTKRGFNDVVREAARQSTYAKQNENSILSLIQNSEAVGMIKALRLIAPDRDIQHLTGGVPLVETEREMKEQQADATKRVIKQCAETLPRSRLTELAGYYPTPVNPPV
jgi:hypothetical protein